MTNPLHVQALENFQSGLLASIGAITVFVADTLTDASNVADTWLSKHGLAVTMLALAIVANVFTIKGLLAERKARIEDRDNELALRRDEAKSGLDSRLKLIEATTAQTEVLKRLPEDVARHLKDILDK